MTEKTFLELFTEIRAGWKKYNAIDDIDSEAGEELYRKCCELEEAIFSHKPQTMQELAIQVLVQLDEGKRMKMEDGTDCPLIKSCKALVGEGE